MHNRYALTGGPRAHGHYTRPRPPPRPHPHGGCSTAEDSDSPVQDVRYLHPQSGECGGPPLRRPRLTRRVASS